MLSVKGASPTWRRSCHSHSRNRWGLWNLAPDRHRFSQSMAAAAMATGASLFQCVESVPLAVWSKAF